MTEGNSGQALMRRVAALERELERLKRDLARTLTVSEPVKGEKPSLFGRVRGDDVTEEMIEQAKRSVLRDPEVS